METRVSLKVEDVFGTMPVFESERLVLRPMEPKDAPFMYEYCSDPEMVKHLPLSLTSTIAEAERSIRGFMDMYAARRCAPWGITLKENDEHIGICGFESWNPMTDRAEIGFIVSRRHWRKGYAMEAATRVMRFGFEHMQLNRLEARVKVENDVSRRLLARMGMQYEGLLREHSYWKGQYHDLELYSLLKKEFKG